MIFVSCTGYNASNVNSEFENVTKFVVKLSIYHPGVFIKLNKMVFISQTHLFIIVMLELEC